MIQRGIQALYMLQKASLSQLEMANTTWGANRVVAAGSLFATKVRERGVRQSCWPFWQRQNGHVQAGTQKESCFRDGSLRVRV
jgi:hypothetical protein